ncbi:MAG: 23S rRNA (uracil(1939)-C(5))-methyltransferase RlmD [Porticoccaceae bacterium]|nr:23S rRNA (uracil(1939)-C(5))-methyltransferase RlmD [Porticoccaceae bacterium]MDG1473478.1 23S rRNA (uracil(1939)-C(5))-methyltransferase RlmD [Porticoccaceae bacterium]
MRVTQTLTCDIKDLSHDGRGVGRVNGKAYFIDGALPEEKVTFGVTVQKRNFGEGRLTNIQSGSAYRVTPECKYFSKCGGCSLQHLEHSQQVEFKKQQILKTLGRSNIAVENILDPLSGNANHYRRRARLAVQRARDGEFLVGFRNARSNRIEPVSHCLVLDPALDALLTKLPSFLGNLKRDIKITSAELVVGDNALAMAIDASRDISLEETNAILQEMKQSTVAQLWWRDSTASSYQRLDKGTQSLEFEVSDDVKIGFEPGQFIQVNGVINRQMIDQMLKLVCKNINGVAVDLFCGSGNLSLPLARHFKRVIGVEGYSSLVDAARRNADFNKISNAEFLVADLNKVGDLNVVTKIASKIDLVVLDPPRQGAAGAMPWVVKSRAKQIMYISCHPSTMVRDAEVLMEAGYKLKHIGAMDMFPHTTHIESMAVFEL